VSARLLDLLRDNASAGPGEVPSLAGDAGAVGGRGASRARHAERSMG
jgi:hypothetical protein